MVKIISGEKAEIGEIPPPPNAYYTFPIDGHVEAYINSTVIEYMIKYAETNKETEIMGFLLGKLRKWKGKKYVYVTHAVGSNEGLDSSSVSVRFTDKTHEELYKKIEQLEENGQLPKDYITSGWYHTHPGHTCFLSPTDLSTHTRGFPEAHQVAIVIDPKNKEIGVFKPHENSYREVKFSICGISKRKLFQRKTDGKVKLYYEKTADAEIRKMQELTKKLKSISADKNNIVDWFDPMPPKMLKLIQKGKISLKKEPNKYSQKLYRQITMLQASGDFGGHDIMFYYTFSIIKYFRKKYFEANERGRKKFANNLNALNLPLESLSLMADIDRFKYKILGMGNVLKEKEDTKTYVSIVENLFTYIYRTRGCVLTSYLDFKEIFEKTQDDNLYMNVEQVTRLFGNLGRNYTDKAIIEKQYRELLHFWTLLVVFSCTRNILEEEGLLI